MMDLQGFYFTSIKIIVNTNLQNAGGMTNGKIKRSFPRKAALPAFLYIFLYQSLSQIHTSFW